MKKVMILIFVCVACVCYGQKLKTDTTKVQYEKFIKLSLNDVNTFVNALEQWKRLSMYDPNASAEDKVRVFKDIELYIMQLKGNTRVDSAIVKPIKKK